MRALAGLPLFLSLAVQAGEVTVIRPTAFVGSEATYYVVLDERPVSDLETRESVRFDAPAGRRVLAIRCPKAMSRTYAETKLERDFGAGPAFFVIEPKFDCVTIRPLEPQTAAALMANTTLRPALAGAYVAGQVAASAPVETRDVEVGPQEAVAAATAAWVDAFNSRDPARLTALYDADAVLLGTRAKKPAAGKAAIAAYFGDAAKRPTNRVALGEHSVRVYGDTAIDSGLYNFFEVRDGTAVMTPARYTLVYRQRDGKWLIVEHHSSRVP